MEINSDLSIQIIRKLKYKKKKKNLCLLKLEMLKMVLEPKCKNWAVIIVLTKF